MALYFPPRVQPPFEYDNDSKRALDGLDRSIWQLSWVAKRGGLSDDFGMLSRVVGG